MPLPEIVPGSLDGGTVGDAFGVSAVEDVDSEGIGDSFPFSAILDTTIHSKAAPMIFSTLRQ